MQDSDADTYVLVWGHVNVLKGPFSARTVVGQQCFVFSEVDQLEDGHNLQKQTYVVRVRVYRHRTGMTLMYSRANRDDVHVHVHGDLLIFK